MRKLLPSEPRTPVSPCLGRWPLFANPGIPSRLRTHWFRHKPLRVDPDQDKKTGQCDAISLMKSIVIPDPRVFPSSPPDIAIRDSPIGDWSQLAAELCGSNVTWAHFIDHRLRK